MKVKKLSLLVLMMVLVFSVALVGCGGSSSTGGDSGSTSGDSGSKDGNSSSSGGDSDAPTETYDLKMSVTVGDQSTWFKAAEKFSAEVKEKTDGRIDISIFPNEQLSGGDSGKGVELVIKGNTDLSYHSTIIYSIVDERFGVVSAPFLFKDLETVDKALAGSGGDAIKGLLREKGVEPVGFGQNGFRQVTNSVHPIKSPDDIKGLKMRIPGITMYIDLWTALGADPTTMTFSEVFTSLQQGTIDGQENPIDVIHSAKLNEVQKYITMWNYSYDPLILGMNKSKFESMHPSDQKVIQEAAANANAYQIELAREAEAKQIEDLKAAGMEFYTPTADELAAFQSTVSGIYDTYESIWGKDLLDALRQ
jgi:tripartite ATP-independent transporter DctP family solute receptor